MWPRGKVEHREPATDAIVLALLSQAAGSGAPPSVEALAAVEAAAGLWSRAFASTTVQPSTPLTQALTPSVLAAIGRGLAVRGDVLFAIDVMEGVELTEAAAWEVRGGTRPETWHYACEFPTPGGFRKRFLPSASVVHLRYATRPGKPWAGVSPLGMADATRALAGWLEKRLAEEAATTTAYVLALPDGAPQHAFEALKSGLTNASGKLHFVSDSLKRMGPRRVRGAARRLRRQALGR